MQFAAGQNKPVSIRALDAMADGAGAMIGSFIYTKLRFGKEIRRRTSEVT